MLSIKKLIDHTITPHRTNNTVFNLEPWGPTTQHQSMESFADHIHIDGVHQINCDENPWHILVNAIDKNPKYILIGFSGRVTLNKEKRPPYFSFRGIAEKSNVGIIAISDPSLNFSKKLSIGWYVGNKTNGDVTQKVAELLDSIIDKTGKTLILAGGSGGGFAALNVHSKMRNGDQAKSFAWNPQTDITKYNNKVLKDYFSSCFTDIPSIPEIIDYFKCNDLPYILKKNKNLDQLIMINGYDHSHIRKHVRRFISNDPTDKNIVFFGNWGMGHVPPDSASIVNIINAMTDGKSITEVTALPCLHAHSKKLLDFSSNKEQLDAFINIRIAVVKLGSSKFVMIKSNVAELFMGHQTIIAIIDKNKKTIFDSSHLLGQDSGEVYFPVKDKEIGVLNSSQVKVSIEDYLGRKSAYYYSFLSNRKIIESKKLMHHN